MDCQDWTPVVLHNNHNKTSKNYKESSNQGNQGNQGLPAVKKYGAGTNTQIGRKYKEDEDGMPITKGVRKGFGQKMQQARQQKGWTQKELAQKIGERVQVVQEYEQERVTNVNNNIVRKIERYLGRLK